jgi:hypothetical protein
MKRILATVALLLVPVTAHAHPGGHTLVCTSKKGAKQSVKVELSRMNGIGWAGPAFSITVDGAEHDFSTEDEMLSFGETVHDAPLGIVHVTADNSEDKTATTWGHFTVTAIPRTVKAYDSDGKRRKWSLADERADPSCYDSNGKATFRALFVGGLGDSSGSTDLDAQILDCELAYDSGMSC